MDTDAAPRRESPWRYALALAITGSATALAALVAPYLHQTNVVMVFLLGVVVAALRLGRGPAIVVVLTSVLSFDFFFVTPYLSFAVSDAQYVVTFAVMLVVGLVITALTSRLRHVAEVARHGEARAVSLYELARDLSAAPSVEGVAEASAKHIEASASARSALLVRDEEDRLSRVVGTDFAIDESAARRVFETGKPLPGDAVEPLIYLPLNAPMRTRGVLVLWPERPDQWHGAEQRRLLETIAALVAIALERVHYVVVAQRTLVGMESERLRSSLLAALSHDLRTPLTAMIGLAETLAMRASDEGSRRDAVVVRDQARQMSSLVENLLEMARLQGGAVRLKRDWQSMEELVGSALDALGPALDGRAVQTDLPTDLPLVRCDAVLVERVLVNLVENAVKYTAPGTRIGIDARQADGRMVTTVWDEGAGIAAGRELAIFEKFARGESESSIPGMGLGLAIAQSIVEAHGGTIVASNRPERGAAITFTLPLDPPPMLEPGSGEPAPDDSPEQERSTA